VRGTVGETFERLILLQIGAAAATRERIEEVVEGLIEQGRIQREEGKTLVDQVAGRARERSAGTRSLIDASVQQGLRRTGLPTREDYEDLLFRVEQLEHRVRMLEDRPVAPPASVTPPPRASGPEGVTGPETPLPGEPETPPPGS
jgi:polyhydroxyalkanoate synthesis regulator phasin